MDILDKIPLEVPGSCLQVVQDMYSHEVQKGMPLLEDNLNFVGKYLSYYFVKYYIAPYLDMLCTFCTWVQIMF